MECQISSVKSGRPRMRLNFGPFIWDGLAQLTRLINFIPYSSFKTCPKLIFQKYFKIISSEEGFQMFCEANLFTSSKQVGVVI